MLLQERKSVNLHHTGKPLQLSKTDSWETKSSPFTGSKVKGLQNWYGLPEVCFLLIYISCLLFGKQYLKMKFLFSFSRSLPTKQHCFLMSKISEINFQISNNLKYFKYLKKKIIFLLNNSEVLGLLRPKIKCTQIL